MYTVQGDWKMSNWRLVTKVTIRYSIRQAFYEYPIRTLRDFLLFCNKIQRELPPFPKLMKIWIFTRLVRLCFMRKHHRKNNLLYLLLHFRSDNEFLLQDLRISIDKLDQQQIHDLTTKKAATRFIVTCYFKDIVKGWKEQVNRARVLMNFTNNGNNSSYFSIVGHG